MQCLKGSDPPTQPEMQTTASRRDELIRAPGRRGGRKSWFPCPASTAECNPQRRMACIRGLMVSPKVMEPGDEGAGRGMCMEEKDFLIPTSLAGTENTNCNYPSL